MDPFASTLKTLHRLIEPITKQWMIIGTSSLYLQGFQVIPDDVDILCTASDAGLIEEALSIYKIALNEDISSNKFRSAFSRYNINGIDVELMGELEVNTLEGWIKLNDVLGQRDEVLFDGKYFRVPNKVDQIKIYNLFGREKDQLALHLLNL